MMNSTINTDDITANVETPTLTGALSSNTLIGQSSSNTLTGNTNSNTLIGAIGSAIIGGEGVKHIYLNNVEQQITNDTAYISLTYDMIYNLPTIPTKVSELENDEGYINSGYATEDDFTALSNNVGLIQNTIDDVVDDIEDIESDIDTINTTLTNKVDTSDFTILQTQVTTNTNNIGTNTNNIATNTSNITTLTNIVDGQAQTLTSATAQIEDNSDAIGTLSNLTTTDKTNLVSAINEVKSDVAGKQDTLVSGTNIKTINSQSLLGSGDITISGGQTTDVQINGTSITSNNTANIETNSTYNASTNKIATMSDLPSLTNYVTNTDYANGTTAGVIKNNNGILINSNGFTYGETSTYSTYSGKGNQYFISKGTLENVLSAYGLTPYKSGDTMTMSARYYCSATITTGTTEVVFCVPVNRSMINVTPTLTSIAFVGRTSGGGYLNNSTNDITKTSSGYTFSIQKTGDWFVRITCTKSSAFTNVSNNTPVAINVIYTFSFS